MSWLAYYHLLRKYHGESEQRAGSDPNNAATHRLALAVWRRANGLPYVMAGTHFRLSSVNGDGPDNKTVLEPLGGEAEPMALSRADMAALLEIFGRLEADKEAGDEDNSFEQ